MNNEDLFLENEFDIDNLDSVELIDIDIIDEQAQIDSNEIVGDVLEEFKDDVINSRIRTKINQYRDTLRLYFKMLRANEDTHDKLLIQISTLPTSAQLYLSLNRLQDSIMNIKSNIDKTINALEECVKSNNIDTQFEKITNHTTDSNEDVGSLCRGSRDFIKEMRGEEE